MATILEAAVSAKSAKVDFIGADRNALISRSETVVENRDTRQMRDIFLQYSEGVRMRFEAENFRVGELAMKVKNRSADVAADVENDFRSQGRRHIILCFLATPEQNLIQNEWIGGTGSVKNVSASPTQPRQR